MLNDLISFLIIVSDILVYYIIYVKINVGAFSFWYFLKITAMTGSWSDFVVVEIVAFESETFVFAIFLTKI